jgi:hypothetical protein
VLLLAGIDAGKSAERLPCWLNDTAGEVAGCVLFNVYMVWSTRLRYELTADHPPNLLKRVERLLETVRV